MLNFYRHVFTTLRERTKHFKNMTKRSETKPIWQLSKNGVRQIRFVAQSLPDCRGERTADVS